MIPNNKPYATKFAVQIDAKTPIRPSLTGMLLLLIIHIGAGIWVWWLPWFWVLCLLSDLIVLANLLYNINHYILGITHYSLSFFMGDAQGWVIETPQKNYRLPLRTAFCTHFLVILVFSHRLILPLFFDSLSKDQFRQLRKVVILEGM